MAEQKTESRTKRITFHLPLDTVQKLGKLAARENQDMSKIIRKAIENYMSIQANKDDIDYITGIIRQEIKAESSKQANRLAAMLFKVGIITSANYFLAVKILSDVISPSMQEDFKDINSNARKLGIDYMKQSGIGVVEFLEDEDAVEQAVGKVKTDFTKV
jgi:predicted DNA-binding protein